MVLVKWVINSGRLALRPARQGSYGASMRMLTLVLSLVFVLAVVSSGSIAQAEETSTTHVVRFGETLSQIAQSYQVPMRTVMDQNGIRNANAIYVGQTLKIPLVSPEIVEALNEPEEVAVELERVDESAKAGLAAAQPFRTTSLNRVYTVRPGDSLGWIALRYGVDLPALRAVNNLSPGQSVRIGQVLVLPATDSDTKVTPPSQDYTIRAGDSLGLIAQRFEIPMQSLMTANRISNPNLIQPGQKLVIPNQSEQRAAPSVGPAQAGFYYHSVRPGETLSHLSLMYDSTPDAIVSYNNLPDNETVYSGLEVRIPFGPPVMEGRRPPSPRSGTEFVISLSRQRCWVFQGDRVVHEWKCSTGYGEWLTRTGTFPVKTKMEMAKSSAYRLDMPYWLGLYDVGRFENGIHGLPVDWDTGKKIWETLVGQPATFGCAMLLDEDAAMLFDFAYIGMPVHIVD
jgi:LysM repeat protein